MKFPYLVKHNGVYYPIGTDVPIEDENGGLNTPVDASGEADVVVEPTIEVKEDVKEIKEDAPKGRKYSEEDLNVPFFSLKALAKKEGLEIPPKAKSSDLKKMLRAL